MAGLYEEPMKARKARRPPDVKGGARGADATRMRVLLVAFGTRGDVQPLIALGRRLRESGHDPVIGAAPGFAGLARGHGLDFRPVGRNLGPWIDANAGLLVAGSPRLLKPAVEYLREETEVAFAQTLAAAQGADMIVSGLHGAAPSVAEALRLAHRTVVFCPQAIPSGDHPPMGLPWTSLPRALNSVLWRLGARGIDLVLEAPVNAARRDLGLEPVDDLVPYLLGPSPIVASDPELGGLPHDAATGIVQTGALVLDSAEALDPGLEDFLDDGEPPVAIGFGSMGDPDPEHTTRMIFEALRASGRRGVVLAGGAGLGDLEPPDHVYVVGSAPHAALLPRVAAFVHHGGAGATAAAARAGVPQIVVPHIADQFYWGAGLWGRGVSSRPIPRSRLTAASLGEAIRFVFDRPEIAARARQLAARIQGTDAAGTITDLLLRDVPRFVIERAA